MDVYQIVTDRIMGLLESGTVPWRKPWATVNGMPRNLVSNKLYRGINTILLGCQQYGSPYWVTYKQATERGGHVKHGEKSSVCVFWKLLDKNTDSENAAPGKVPLLRYYNLFNLEQCEGIISPPIDVPTYQFTPIEKAEQIVSGMKDRPEISYGGNRASYTPISDKVRMPYEDRFEKCEELVAEFTSSFLCGVAGISNATVELNASYIDGWLSVLKKDKRLLVTAAAQAQRASDYILNVIPVTET